MRCPSCSAEVKDGAEVCPVCQGNITSSRTELVEQTHAATLQPGSWLKFLSRYTFFPILLLIITHYILLFVLQLDITPISMNLIYCAVAFPFGYNLFSRTRNRVGVASALGLLTGIAAVTGMSTMVFVLLHQSFFPDERQIQEFIETSMAIMLAYASGNATANFIHQVLPDNMSFTNFGPAIVALVRGKSGQTLAERLGSLEAVIKALVAVVLAFGTLLVAVRKLIF
jgi:hypothetical protein